VKAAAAAPIGMPGCPDLAFSIASAARKRMVLMHISSRGFRPFMVKSPFIVSDRPSERRPRPCETLLQHGATLQQRPRFNKEIGTQGRMRPRHRPAKTLGRRNDP